MATKGTFGAYRQLNPIQSDFGDPMERFAQNAMAIQNRKRQEQEAKRKEKLEISMKLDDELTKLEPVVTGMQSVDQINYDFYTKTIRELGDIHRAISENPSMAMDPKIRMKRAQLRNSPKILKALESTVVDRYKTMSQGIADGSLSKANVPVLNEMQSYFGAKQKDGSMSPNYMLDMDDSGNILATIKTTDGRMVRTKVNDVINGYKYEEPIGFVDMNKYTSDLVNDLGKDQRLTRVRGGVAVQQTWNEELEQAQRGILRKQLEGDQGPSDLAKTFWVDGMNQGPLSEVNVQAVEDELINQMRSKYDETTSGLSRDPRPRVTSSDKPSEVEEIRRGITPMTASDSGDPVPLHNLTAKRQPGTEGPEGPNYYGFAVPTVELTAGAGGERFVDNLFVNPETGDILYTAVDKRGRTMSPAYEDQSVSTYENVFKPTETELNVIANRLTFTGGAKELSRFLQSKYRKTFSGGVQVGDTVYK